ncbi:MAG: hypothetical protein KA319_03410 [Ferruginibacter sp.]|nr:hypothetical protein [Ferruginibacter sp.]
MKKLLTILLLSLCVQLNAQVQIPGAKPKPVLKQKPIGTPLLPDKPDLQLKYYAVISKGPSTTDPEYFEVKMRLGYKNNSTTPINGFTIFLSHHTYTLSSETTVGSSRVEVTAIIPPGGQITDIYTFRYHLEHTLKITNASNSYTKEVIAKAQLLHGVEESNITNNNTPAFSVTFRK